MSKSLRERWNTPLPPLGSIALTAIVVTESAILVVLSVAFLISLNGLRRAVRRYRSGWGRS
jgi:hypothetical protein